MSIVTFSNIVIVYKPAKDKHNPKSCVFTQKENIIYTSSVNIL